MKNRRNIIVAFLLCACLIVGVGYAALTDTLRIDGTAAVKHENANNVFDGCVVFDNTITHGVNQLDTIEYGADADTATVTVNSLTVEGSTAIFELIIKNNYQEDIYVFPTIDESSALYDKTLIGLSSTWQGTMHKIASESTITYTLTVECLRTINADETTSFAIGFSVTDTPADGTPYRDTVGGTNLTYTAASN